MTPDFLKTEYNVILIPAEDRNLYEVSCCSFGLLCYVFHQLQSDYCKLSHVLLDFDLQNCYYSQHFVCYL